MGSAAQKRRVIGFLATLPCQNKTDTIAIAQLHQVKSSWSPLQGPVPSFLQLQFQNILLLFRNQLYL